MALPLFRGRLLGSPLLTTGFSETSRDYAFGWQLEPRTGDEPTAQRPLDLTLGIQATSREGPVYACIAQIRKARIVQLGSWPLGCGRPRPCCGPPRSRRGVCDRHPFDLRLVVQECGNDKRRLVAPSTLEDQQAPPCWPRPLEVARVGCGELPWAFGWPLPSRGRRTVTDLRDRIPARPRLARPKRGLGSGVRQVRRRPIAASLAGCS